MNSTGTSHRRPLRVGGTGSEMSRPETEASACSGVRRIVFPL